MIHLAQMDLETGETSYIRLDNIDEFETHIIADCGGCGKELSFDLFEFQDRLMDLINGEDIVFYCNKDCIDKPKVVKFPKN